MALGTITVAEASAGQGPVFFDRLTIVGDGTYPAGGTAAFEATFQALEGKQAREIIAVIPQHDTEINALEYDHANDKLFSRVKATGVESGVADQSALTYSVLIMSR